GASPASPPRGSCPLDRLLGCLFQHAANKLSMLRKNRTQCPQSVLVSKDSEKASMDEVVAEHSSSSADPSTRLASHDRARVDPGDLHRLAGDVRDPRDAPRHLGGGL